MVSSGPFRAIAAWRIPAASVRRSFDQASRTDRTAGRAKRTELAIAVHHNPGAGYWHAADSGDESPGLGPLLANSNGVAFRRHAEIANVDIVVASGQVLTSGSPHSDIVAACGIGEEGVDADRIVVIACSIRLQRTIANGGIQHACRIVLQSLRPVGGILRAGAVELHSARAGGGVVVRCVELQSLKSFGRVVVSRRIAEQGRTCASLPAGLECHTRLNAN
jgi:hypothetical protein